MVLVRIETTDGAVGWGECFAYGCLRATLAAAEDMVFPLLLDREVTDIVSLNEELQFRLHIFGRYGITMFAISGVDIALWDIAAQMRSASHWLMSSASVKARQQVPVYASLVMLALRRC